MVKFKIEIDKEKCIGCGACVSTCPENFEMETGGDFKAFVKHPEVDKVGCNREAESICPVNAITVSETH